MTEDKFFDEGAKSTFNEASLRMQRIDASDRLIESMWLNPLLYYPELNKRGYEVIITELNSKFIRVWGKLSEDERNKGKEFRNKILDFQETKVILENRTEQSLGSTRNFKSVNRTNWKELRDILFEFQVLLEEYYEKHELTTPNKEEEGGYD